MQVLGHITADTIERYRLRQLPTAQLLDVQAHAAQCEECRVQLAANLGLDAAFGKMRAEFSGFESEREHLLDEQLVAFVDGTLDEVAREIAESHLAVCTDCAGDMSDLRRYQRITADAQTEIAPAFNAAPAQASKTFRQRLSSFAFIHAFGTLVPTAAAVTVVAVVLLGLWFANRTSPVHQVVKLEPERQRDPVPSQKGATSPATLTETLMTPPPQENRPPHQTQKSPAGNSVSGTRAQEVALNDGGGRVMFDSRGNLRGLDGLPPDARNVVRRSIQTQSVETPRTLGDLAGGANGVLMSSSRMQSGVPFALVEPVGKIVRRDRPVLRWRPLAGATRYSAAVVDSSFQVIAESQPLASTEWTLPVTLRRGQIYYWQVTATLADGRQVTSPSSPAPQAKFRTLEEGAANELQKLEAMAPDSHLARGVLYARAGLLDEAEAEFQKLVNINPRSPLARKLLQSVRRK